MRAVPSIVALLVLVSGPASAADGAAAIDWLNRMRDAVKRCWVAPDPGGATRAPVIVELWLGRDGRVEKAVVADGGSPGDSWREEMAARARRAVLRCQPYPVPPDWLRGELRVTVTFPLSSR